MGRFYEMLDHFETFDIRNTKCDIRNTTYDIQFLGELKTVTILMVISVMFFLVSTITIAGGRGKAGTCSGAQLLIPVGARDLSLGGATVAVTEGVESIYWNPAGLARLEKSGCAMFSYMPYIADIGVSYGGIGVNMGGFGMLGFSIKALNIGQIEITTADIPDGTGETFAPTFFTLGMTYARNLTDRVRIGANIKVISERIPRASATGFAVDVGMQYRGVGGIRNLFLGVVVKNFGPALRYDGPGLYREVNDPNSAKATSHYKISTASFELPSIVEIGLSYRHKISEFGQLTASYLFQNNNFSDDENKLGLEFSFKDRAFIRVGYTMTANNMENYGSIFGLVFGGGVHLKTGGIDFWIDYAYRSVEFFNSSNVFSIKLGF